MPLELSPCVDNASSFWFQVVERARNSGEWQDFITWGDEDAPLSERTNEFFEPDYSGTIRFDAATLEAENSEESSRKAKSDE